MHCDKILKISAWAYDTIVMIWCFNLNKHFLYILASTECLLSINDQWGNTVDAIIIALVSPVIKKNVALQVSTSTGPIQLHIIAKCFGTMEGRSDMLIAMR